MHSTATEHPTATDRAWDALAETLDALPSAALVRISKGEELMPKRSGIRTLIARTASMWETSAEWSSRTAVRMPTGVLSGGKVRRIAGAFT